MSDFADFEEGELRERIRSAFWRATASVGFLGDQLQSRIPSEARSFVRLWIEEALREERNPTARQAARELALAGHMPMRLTDAQKKQLVAQYQDCLEKPNAKFRERRNIPMGTFRPLHKLGLVSTDQHVTELGGQVALVLIKDTKKKSREAEK